MQKYTFILIFIFSFASCEETFIPETITTEQDIVVEGYIEAASMPIPPYVILTRSQSFFLYLLY